MKELQKLKVYIKDVAGIAFPDSKKDWSDIKIYSYMDLLPLIPFHLRKVRLYWKRSIIMMIVTLFKNTI